MRHMWAYLLAAALAAVFAAAVSSAAPKAKPLSDEEMNRKLDSVRVDGDFDGTALGEAVEYLCTLSHMNIVIDPRARPNGQPANDVPVTLKLPNVLLRQVIEAMCKQTTLKYVVQDQVVFLTEAAEVEDVQQPKADEKTLATLDKTVVSVGFVDSSLPEVVQTLAEKGGVHVALDFGAKSHGTLAADLKVSFKAGDITATALLNWVCRITGLRWTTKDGFVLITDKEHAK